jgi:hypothetical protein
MASGKARRFYLDSGAKLAKFWQKPQPLLYILIIPNLEAALTVNPFQRFFSGKKLYIRLCIRVNY